MNKIEVFWQTYLNLEKEAIDLSKYIFFTDEVLEKQGNDLVPKPCESQLKTFSPYIADLLVRCCIQIEAISKELYYANGGKKEKSSKDLYFDGDCLKLIDQKWETHKKVVTVVAPFFNFTRNENIYLKPLREAHKRQGTLWERAYQAVKHDRYSCLCYGNVKSFIHALAALYLLNVYYRNPEWITTYQGIRDIDYSLGSSIFSVVPPEVSSTLWYDNSPINSGSPFVVQYQDESFKKIQTIQKREDESLRNYLKEQPEFKERDFQPLFLELIQRKGDNLTGLDFCKVLSKFRLNKKIPSSLPFEKKKSMLIQSEEWHGWIHLHNKHLSEDELSEENIQKEIDSVANLWGIELMKRFQQAEWLNTALNFKNCRVFIKDCLSQ